MKKFSKRLLTFVLACAMVFGLSGMTAFAAEADGQDAQNGIVTFADKSGYDRPAIDSDPDGTYKEYEPDFQWYIDLGPKADSYEINTPEELAAFSDIVNNTDLPSGVVQNSFAGQTVTLGQDIVMNDPDDVKSEDGEWGGTGTPTLHVSENAYAFTPIGNMRFNPNGSVASGNSFEGTFDGQGHTIENLFVFSGLDEDGYDGLFGTVGSDNYAEKEEEGTIVGCLKNFTITGLIWVRGGYYDTEIDFAGAVCARLTAGAAIEDVTNEARIYAPYTDNVGGIVGFAGTPHAMGGSAETGGGTNTSNPGYEENPSGYNTFVLRCANEGPVSAFHKNGGIAGENAATIKYCYNTGWIQCRRNYAGVRMGGIAGTNGNNGYACEESVIAYCYNTGAISNDGGDDLLYAVEDKTTGTPTVRGYGGIVGSNYGGDGKNEIYNCYNIGAIPQGYADYNSIASNLDDSSSYGYGALVSIRNNYTPKDATDIVINSASTVPQETGILDLTMENFTSPGYEDNDILTCLGPYFVHDEYGDNPKYDGFPVLWWQKAGATLPALTGITIAEGPDKTTGYINGDNFDPTGMVVYAEYENGVRALLTPDIDYYNYWYTRTDGFHCQYEPESGEYLDGSATYVEITYTDGDTTVSAWQPINGAVPTVNKVDITSDMDGNTKTYDGEEVTLTANADVDPAGAELTYQWYNGDDAIEGATDSELTLEGNVSDSGTYKCVVNASFGNDQAAPATGEITITIKKAAQDISYEATEVDKYAYSGNFINELTQTTVYGTITYESEDPDVATVDPASGEVTIRATGTTTITATVAGSDNYAEDTASYTLTVSEADIDSEIDVDGETAEWDANDDEWIDEVTYDGEPIELSMVLNLSEEEQAEVKTISYQWYTVAENGTATPISGATDSTYTLTGDAVNAGDYVYQCEAVISFNNGHEHTVTSSPIEVSIAKAAQVISFEKSAVAKMVGDEPFTNTLIKTTVDSSAEITYSSTDTDVATVDEDGEVTIKSDGTTTITVTVSETANYKGAAASYELTVDPEQAPVINDLTITSTLDGDAKTYDGVGVSLTANADVEPASAEVTYQWYKGDDPIGEASPGNLLNLDGDVSDTGTYRCVVSAVTVAGSAEAEDAITITITQAEQLIEFTEDSVTKQVGETYQNELTSDSVVFGEITYESDDASVATVDADGSVTIVGIGSATITATAAGSDNYTEASGSYTITGTDEGLAVEVKSDVDGNEKTYNAEPVVLTAEASSSVDGVTFTFQWYKDGDEMNGETGESLILAGDVSDSGSYTCEVTVTYPSDVTYTVDSDAVTITITEATQEISFEESSYTKAVGDEPFMNTLIETTVDAAGGAAISYESSDETIATVDETGLVTILGEGNVTIKATVSATANYEEATASYDLTVEAAQVTTVDKTVLEAAIADAESLTASNYDEDKWNVLEEALAAAKAADENSDATQSEVNQAAIALIEAIAGLEDAADKSDLMEEYVDALDRSESDYTPESWAPFEEALGNALTVLLDPDATQADIEAAAEALNTAMENLVKKGDTSGTGGNVKNGLCQITAGKEWGYFVNDKVDTSYTGFASNQYGDWYVVNGYIHFDQNTVAKDTTGKNGDKGVGTAGTWYYVIGNKVQHDFTGLAHYKNQYGWWYINDGKVTFNHNGVDKNQNGWWYVKDSKVEFGHSGVDKNQYGWWYITGGKVNFDFTGLANYKNQYGWWYIKDGKVDFNHNGVDRNRYGWWYVKNGKVDFSYNGRASNVYGTWNIVNGKVVF